MKKRLFQGGTVVSGTKIRKADVLTKGEKILAVGESLHAEDAEKIDLSGKYLFPGFIDPHTHMDLEVSGTVTADGFDSGRVLLTRWIAGIKRQRAEQTAIMRSIWLCPTGIRM